MTLLLFIITHCFPGWF